MQRRFHTDLTPAALQALSTRTFTMALTITAKGFRPDRCLARGMTPRMPNEDANLSKNIARMVDNVRYYGIARRAPKGTHHSIEYAWVYHKRNSHADIRIALAVPLDFISRVQGAVPHAATKARWATTMRIERLYQPEQAVGFLTDRKTFTTGLTLHTSWDVNRWTPQAAREVPTHAA